MTSPQSPTRVATAPPAPPEASRLATEGVSVVLPIYNERGNLTPLLQEIADALRPMGVPFEIVCVDDCSTDGSLEELRRIRESIPQVRILRHKRNLGQSAAIMLGMQHSRGAFIGTLDSDGQNDPADIPKMVREIRAGGWDCATGVRKKRQDSLSKRLASRIANWARNQFVRDGLRDAGCGVRVVRREAIAGIPTFRGVHRFIATILKFHGYKVKQVAVNHRHRKHGVSKYTNFGRLVEASQDLAAMHWYRRRCIPPNRLQGEE